MPKIISKYYCLYCSQIIEDINEHLLSMKDHVVIEAIVNSSEPTTGVYIPIAKGKSKKLVFKISNSRASPKDIDISHLNYAIKTTMERGDIIKEEYYETYNLENNEYTNLILYIEYEYINDEDQLPISMTKRVNYLLENDEIGEIITSTEYYMRSQSIAKRTERLSNRMNQIKGYLVEKLQERMGNGLKAFEYMLLVVEQMTLNDVANLIGELHPAYSSYVGNNAFIMPLYLSGNTDAMKLCASYIQLEYFTDEYREFILSVL